MIERSMQPSSGGVKAEGGEYNRWLSVELLARVENPTRCIAAGSAIGSTFNSCAQVLLRSMNAQIRLIKLGAKQSFDAFADGACGSILEARVGWRSRDHSRDHKS